MICCRDRIIKQAEEMDTNYKGKIHVAIYIETRNLAIKEMIKKMKRKKRGN